MVFPICSNICTNICIYGISYIYVCTNILTYLQPFAGKGLALRQEMMPTSGSGDTSARSVAQEGALPEEETDRRCCAKLLLCCVPVPPLHPLSLSRRTRPRTRAPSPTFLTHSITRVRPRTRPSAPPSYSPSPSPSLPPSLPPSLSRSLSTPLSRPPSPPPPQKKSPASSKGSCSLSEFSCQWGVAGGCRKHHTKLRKPSWSRGRRLCARQARPLRAPGAGHRGERDRRRLY